MTGRASPTVIDLFCGAGGLSLGFQAAGCRILAGVDADESAGATFSRNLSVLQADPPVVFADGEGNLEELDLDRITSHGRPDILVGGPPCQGFSMIGRGKIESLSDEGFEDDPRNVLYARFIAAARRWQPRAVVMENVPGMLSVKGENVAEVVADDMERAGYRVRYAVLNAVWYGVPQLRERLFFIGIRRDLNLDPVMPVATHSAEVPVGYAHSQRGSLLLPLFDFRDARVAFAPRRVAATSVQEAIGDLPKITEHLTEVEPRRGEFRRRVTYGSAPGGAYADLMRAWPGFPTSTDVDDHAIRRTVRDYETFRRMRPGDRYPQALAIAQGRLAEELASLLASGGAPELGSPEYQALVERFVPPYPVEIFVDKWRKLVRGLPSWTVPAHLAKDTYSHIHYDDEQARSISIREAARLQSFPDAFKFEGNMGDCFRQIGNAVPPVLAWVVAACVMRTVGEKPNEPPPIRNGGPSGPE